jgi:hypothetical protein
MSNLDKIERLFVIWASTLQLCLIAHFAVRKRFYESYTMQYGWVAYALAIPAVVVSILLLLNGKSWSFWLGGFLFMIFSLFGYWVDYIADISFRSPFRPDVGVPYVILYLGSLMFYWWPVGMLSRPLWFFYTVLFTISTVLNIISH